MEQGCRASVESKEKRKKKLTEQGGRAATKS